MRLLTVPPRLRLLLVLLTASAFGPLAASMFGAETVLKYPADKPIVSITLPDGWTFKPGSHDALECTAPDDPAFFFDLVRVTAEGVVTLDDLKALLPKMADATASTLKMTDAAEQTLQEKKNSHGVTMVGHMRTGKVGADTYVVLAAGYVLDKAKLVTILLAVPEKTLNAKGDVLERIFDTVAPVP